MNERSLGQSPESGQHETVENPTEVVADIHVEPVLPARRPTKLHFDKRIAKRIHTNLTQSSRAQSLPSINCILQEVARINPDSAYFSGDILETSEEPSPSEELDIKHFTSDGNLSKGACGFDSPLDSILNDKYDAVDSLISSGTSIVSLSEYEASASGNASSVESIYGSADTVIQSPKKIRKSVLHRSPSSVSAATMILDSSEESDTFTEKLVGLTKRKGCPHCSCGKGKGQKSVKKECNGVSPSTVELTTERERSKQNGANERLTVDYELSDCQSSSEYKGSIAGGPGIDLVIDEARPGPSGLNQSSPASGGLNQAMAGPSGLNQSDSETSEGLNQVMPGPSGLNPEDRPGPSSYIDDGGKVVHFQQYQQCREFPPTSSSVSTSSTEVQSSDSGVSAH